MSTTHSISLLPVLMTRLCRSPVKYNAYQVAPAELEALLLTHPGIAEAAVVSSPDAQAGEVPKAFLVSDIQ